MVRWHLAVYLYGPLRQLYLLLEVTQLAHGLSLQVVEITGLSLASHVESLFTSFREFFPLLEVQVGVGLDEIALFCARHAQGKLEEILVLLLALHALDLLRGFLVGLQEDGSTFLEVIQFHLHISILISELCFKLNYTQSQYQKWSTSSPLSPILVSEPLNLFNLGNWNNSSTLIFMFLGSSSGLPPATYSCSSLFLL